MTRRRVPPALARSMLVLVATLTVALPRGAVAARFAVVIGSDEGAASEPRLRYAEEDARRIARVLTSIGDFLPENTSVLVGASVAEVRGAIQMAQQRLVRSGGDGLLLIYYSGHADSASLHIRGEVLPLREVQALLEQSSAATRLLLIDACRSGALTQTKGGRRAGNFDLEVTPVPDPRGTAIITSSAAGEDSQESEELGASFFTHHLASGLLGAADADRDGMVTLAEAFAYTARHTLVATSTTFAGPQHPTFKIDLGGREELVLTRPGNGSAFQGSGSENAGIGHLALREPGWYFIRRADERTLVAEITSETSDRPLALPAGRYDVTERTPDHLLTGTFTVTRATTTEVSEARLRRVDFGQVVRKGGTSRTHAVGLFVEGGFRGSLLGLGAAPTLGLGARLDLARLSLQAGVTGSESSTTNGQNLTLGTSELQAYAGAFRAFDAARLTWLVGGELGVSRFLQEASEQAGSVRSYAAILAPTSALELPFGGRYFVSLEAALPVYVVDATSSVRTSSGRSVHLTYRGLLTTGGYL